MLEMQKPFFVLVQAGSTCHDEEVHVHTFERRMKANGCLKYIFYPITHLTQ